MKKVMETSDQEKTNQDLYDQQLLHEHDLKQSAEMAGLNKKKAELTLIEAQKEIKGLKKYLPFLGKEERNTIESAQNKFEQWSEKERAYLAQLAECEQQLDVITLAKIRNERPPEYENGIAIKDFYGMARKRVEVFRMRVRDFLKALGQARGAMSTGYNNAANEYTSIAIERLRIAQESGRKLDIALADIELLESEFRSKASGTGKDDIKMTQFSHVEYERGVKSATSLPIAQAQMRLDQTLKDCENLRDHDIDSNLEKIDRMEDSHEELMLEIVRKFWRKEQKKLLSNTKRVSILRGYINE